MSNTVQPVLEQNFLQPTKFQLIFDRVANSVFYLTKVAIPSIELTEALTPNPFTDLYVPGDKVLFKPLTFTFLMDAQFSGWVDIFNWMGGVGFPQTFDQYANLANTAIRSPGRPAPLGVRPPYSDATLNIYSSKNNPAFRFNFTDCYPIALEQVDLDYQSSAEEVITCEASFRYSYYTFQAY